MRAVNGASVRNARHAAELLAPFVAGVEAGAPPPAPYVAIEFASTDATAVFEARALREMTPGILKQHKILTWTSLSSDPPILHSLRAGRGQLRSEPTVALAPILATVRPTFQS